MRRVYVIQEVGDNCEECSLRSGDSCRLFNERLYSRSKPGGFPHNPAGTEYLMIEACRNGENPPLHFKPLARCAEESSAGYAEAVADVVAMMRDHVRRAENVMRKSHFDRGPFDASTLQAGAYVRGAAWGIDQIADGAHVGAAKKGGG